MSDTVSIADTATISASDTIFSPLMTDLPQDLLGTLTPQEFVAQLVLTIKSSPTFAEEVNNLANWKIVNSSSYSGTGETEFGTHTKTINLANIVRYQSIVSYPSISPETGSLYDINDENTPKSIYLEPVQLVAGVLAHELGHAEDPEV